MLIELYAPSWSKQELVTLADWTSIKYTNIEWMITNVVSTRGMQRPEDECGESIILYVWGYKNIALTASILYHVKQSLSSQYAVPCRPQATAGTEPLCRHILSQFWCKSEFSDNWL